MDFPVVDMVNVISFLLGLILPSPYKWVAGALKKFVTGNTGTPPQS